MAKRKRWYKAVIISLLFHAIISTGFGWIVIKAFAGYDTPEQYIGLELISESAGLAEINGNSAPNKLTGNSNSADTASAPITDVATAYKEQELICSAYRQQYVGDISGS